MKNLKVSVIMGAYNEKIEWVDEAIESILRQTYKNFEFIVVLDNPDNQELKNYLLKKEKKEDKLKVIINEKNLGLVKTLNKAIELSDGEYIARMDADDISIKNRLELQMDYINENKGIDLLGGRIRFIDEDNKIIAGDNYRPQSFEEIKVHLKHWNAFAHPTLIYSKKAIVNIGKYREIDCAEDYDLVTRFILSGYRVENINDVILEYRVRETSISQSNKVKQFLVSEEIKKVYIQNRKGNQYKFNEEQILGKLSNEKYCNQIEKYIDIRNSERLKKGINSLRNKELFLIFIKDLVYKIFRK